MSGEIALCEIALGFGGELMDYNLADLFEYAADTFTDRECLIVDRVEDQQRRTFGEMEGRSNRLAHHLTANGVGPGDHVGIYGLNCAEWVEAMWAAFKIRAIPININYRYVNDELRYIFSHADLVSLVFQRQFTSRVHDVRDSLVMLKHSVVIDDGTPAVEGILGATDYETALVGHTAERDFGIRSGDDTYILYTGGTTGSPKGVVWRHVDQFFAFGGTNPATGRPVSSPEELVDRARTRDQATLISFAPLMHNNGQWAVIGGALGGNRTVLVSRFDPVRAWRLVEQEKVAAMMLIGDAMALPLVDALSGAVPRFDTASLRSISSGGAALSAQVKRRLIEALPRVRLSEVIGSTESGLEAHTVLDKDSVVDGGARVRPVARTVVLDEELNEVGVGGIGKIARSGHLPLGYLKDPVRTEQTFVTVRGVRHVIPGDFARVEDDGSITLLGRGAGVINTGGEKVFPEEVEAVVKAHPDVRDATIVGVPDERWGQSVSAVVQPTGRHPLTLEALQEHCREHLAGYKLPRELHLVELVERQPTGKPDYRWAYRIATEARGG